MVSKKKTQAQQLGVTQRPKKSVLKYNNLTSYKHDNLIYKDTIRTIPLNNENNEKITKQLARCNMH